MDHDPTDRQAAALVAPADIHDRLDREAEPIPPDHERHRKWNCRRCTIAIGPGYLRRTIWYDRLLDLGAVPSGICSACADARPPGSVVLALSRAEVDTLGCYAIFKLIKERFPVTAHA